jgi:acyl carrier protein
MADMRELEEKVRDIIVEELGVERDKLSDGASFMEDLGADSLDTVELVMAFEKEFDIDIPDEEAEKLRTVGGREVTPCDAASSSRGSASLRLWATPLRTPGKG